MGIFSQVATSEQRNTRVMGILLMLAGICLFSFGDATGKYLVATYPVGQLLLLRAIAALVLFGPIIWQHRARFRNLERPRLQFIRVVMSSLEVAAFFWAAHYLPLADVITYYLACPIFVTAGSAIFLKEKVGWRRWSAIAVGFCGVLIALQPSAETVTWPAMIALFGSMSFAGLMLTTRLLRETHDVVLTSTQFFGTFTLGLILVPFGWVTPNAVDGGLFILAAVVAISALLCVNRSLKLAPASVVVPYQYSMIIWAVIFGYVVFGEIPTLATLAGATLIVGAGLYIFVREQQLGRQNNEVSPPVV